MRIRKLAIQGFKSFADRVVLQFDSPVCGVVGPNGCGKSNVIDAIKWVMGEQSARKLRGSQMQDIIFNGSEDRGPMGVAEVTISFDNDGVGVPPEYLDLPEIAVTRRLFRTGESEYLINKQVVRLRDITDLFLGTGVGSKAYAIIEQDRVGMLVNARAEERRRVIEEAAGITKYKARRAAAERKLGATEQNLARISDIVGELGKRLGSLHRQARKAERFKRLRAEAQQIDVHKMTARYLELRALDARDRDRLCLLTDRSDRLETDLLKLEADIEVARLALLDDEKRLSATQARLYELDSQVQLAEQEIQHSESERVRLKAQVAEATEERARLSDEQARLIILRDELATQDAAIVEGSSDVELRLQRLSERIEELGQLRQRTEESQASAREALFEQRTREVELRSNLESMRQRRRDLDEELRRQRQELVQAQQALDQTAGIQHSHRAAVERAREQRDELTFEVDTTRQELERIKEQQVAAEQELEQARRILADRESRLSSLREVEQSHAAAPAGVQQALAAATELGLPDVHGVLADVLLVPEQDESALAAVLGATLQAILVDSTDSALALLKHVREHELGRVRVVARDQLASATGAGAAADSLATRVEIDAGWRPLVRDLLRDVQVVHDLAEARQRRSEGAPGTLVTRGGEVLDPHGVWSAGAQEENALGALRLHREIRETESLLAGLEEAVGLAQQRRDGVADRREELEVRVDELRRRQQELALELVEKEQALRGLADQQSRMHAEHDRARSALERTEKQHRGTADEVARLHREMQQCLGLGARHRLLAEAWAAEGERFDAELQVQIEHLTEVRVRVAASRERRESTARRQQETEAALDDVTARQLRVERAVERDQQEDIRRAAAIEAARETASRCAHEASELRERLGADRESYEAQAGQITEMEATTRESRRHLTGLRNEQSELTVHLREYEVNLAYLVERADERYQVALLPALHEFHLLPLPGVAEDERLNQVQRSIESMGEINLAAATEYEELDQRHRFLSTQQDDLTHAVQQLKRAITKIDRTTKQRFREAFAAINEKFQQVFPRLFGGGHAHLELTTPDDLLATGIEILAQPPGKKLQAVSLMSGGEKALTAISLIFSVFLIKPSPFCLLDEVDAPLDDANVNRFIDLLRDMSALSQFVFISHNRLTMEVADRLYGVTMEKPGVSKVVSVQLRPSRRPDLGAEAA
ncbi:MAG: chromosome segregation protein SMC [Pseudomonadota bacterium]